MTVSLDCPSTKVGPPTFPKDYVFTKKGCKIPENIGTIAATGVKPMTYARSLYDQFYAEFLIGHRSGLIYMVIKPLDIYFSNGVFNRTIPWQVLDKYGRIGFAKVNIILDCPKNEN